MHPRRISAANVLDACLIPEKVEPVVDNPIVVMFATLIWEESDPVRENTTDLGMINTA
jgi:hypothetical protein